MMNEGRGRPIGAKFPGGQSHIGGGARRKHFERDMAKGGLWG